MLDSDTSGGRSLQGRSAVHGYTVEVLEERIGYRFRDVALLKQAGEACPEADPEGLQHGSLRGRAAAGPQRAGGEDPRKQQIRGNQEFYSAMHSIQRTENKPKDQRTTGS